jgi:drug/metabolite transporter (DMT)-like permease
MTPEPAFGMQVFWAYMRRHFREIAVVPILIGTGLAFLTGRTFLIGIGAVWFLAVIAAQVGTKTFHSVQSKLPRRKRDAFVSFLQYGGYSIAAASMASYFAFAFWTSYRPNWLMKLTFAGILMFFSSAFVHKGRPRRNVHKQKEDSIV